MIPGWWSACPGRDTFITSAVGAARHASDLGAAGYIAGSALAHTNVLMAASASRGDATARPVEKDLLFACSLAMNLDVSDDVQASDQETVRRAVDAHQSPGFVRAHVKLL
jgi:hypothetical protein